MEEKRKFVINTDSERSDWEIVEKGFLENYQTEKRKTHYPSDSEFGIENIDKQGKVKRIFDAFIDDDRIDYASKKKRYHEIVDFEVIIDWKTVERFTGNFVDALKYIKDFWEKAKKAEMESDKTW